MNSGPIDETARRQFESDWVSGDPKTIDFYVPDWLDQDKRGTLEELVLIDLEFRWSQWIQRKQQRELSGEPETAIEPPPTIEPYVREYPVLRERATLNRLVEECLQLAQTHKAPLQARHVSMGIAFQAAATEPGGIQQRGVVALVLHNGIAA